MVLDNPEVLTEISDGLHMLKKPKLVGDCAEVMTKVAEQNPSLVAPHSDALLALLFHKTTRIRWEAAHALALVAHLVPDKIIGSLPMMRGIIESDTSVIVRDYTIDMAGNIAKAGEREARLVLPLLREALIAWDGRHRGHVLEGLLHVLGAAPDLAAELETLAGPYADDAKKVVQKSAKKLLKACAAATER